MVAFTGKFDNRKNLTSLFSKELKGIYEEREAESIANIVIEDLTGKTHLQLFTEPDKDWTEGEKIRIKEILQQLEEGEPIQYILGKTEFFELDFDLRPGVLIPRNETEELVDWVIRDNRDKSKNLNILDIGCGSGIIPVTLAKNLPDASVYAVDKSREALQITTENGEKNNVNMVCGLMDILKPKGFFAKKKYDIIVSNPPYVLESQMPFMDRRVSRKEPAMALFVPDNDPLVYYKAIISFALGHLKPGGGIYVEINDMLGNETLREFDKHFAVTELRRDVHGKNRMIRASNGKK